VKLSVIVPAFNEEKLIANTLQSIRTALAAFSERGWEWEIIVCDNNSTDRTGELARAAGATVVFEPVNQIARARNAGAGAATGDWLLFIDADSRPSRELLADVAEAIATGRFLAGGSTLRLDGGSLLARIVTATWNCISRVGKYFAGSFIFCEAAAFRHIGGFSAKLYAGEELDLTKLLKELARGRGKELVILHRHPQVTSDRKLRLYSMREHLRLVGRTIWNWRGTVSDPQACHVWYDGRR
jgi:glycosyltransferase involved in cell wall biosynthesis